MNTTTSVTGSIMNSTSMQQLQQQTQEVQKQAETRQQDISAASESAVNDLDLSVAYEVNISAQVEASYAKPQGEETVSSDETGASAAAAQSTTQSSDTTTTTADTSSGTSSSDSNLSFATEQQMQTMVSEGTITRSQMVNELERRNSGLE